ncbi:unnamed protein product [Durusdinium trenchii]|uniref:Uncharacterized protein n=2 Tax=Durusdinium trenchii TaxID=1381693 RepID=A0ABP0HDX2_9DINO
MTAGYWTHHYIKFVGANLAFFLSLSPSRNWSLAGDELPRVIGLDKRLGWRLCGGGQGCARSCELDLDESRFTGLGCWAFLIWWSSTHCSQLASACWLFVD